MLPINLVNDLGHQKLEAREWFNPTRVRKVMGLTPMETHFLCFTPFS